MKTYLLQILRVKFWLQKVDIESEKDVDNLYKVFTITQFTLKNVSRKNREAKIEIQKSSIKSFIFIFDLKINLNFT